MILLGVFYFELTSSFLGMVFKGHLRKYGRSI